MTETEYRAYRDELKTLRQQLTEQQALLAECREALELTVAETWDTWECNKKARALLSRLQEAERE